MLEFFLIDHEIEDLVELLDASAYVTMWVQCEKGSDGVFGFSVHCESPIMCNGPKH